MAETPQHIASNYPLPVYNYRVSILSRDEKAGAEAPFVSFSKVSGLAIDYEKVEYRHGASYKEGAIILPGIQSTFQITLEKGLVQKGSFLYDWIHPDSQKGAVAPTRKDLLISLCKPDGDAVVSWQVFGALPFKLAAPNFDANTSEVALESLELAAPKMVVEYHE